MRILSSYAEWCSFFDTVASDVRDDSYIQTIASSTIPWTSGVAERFVQSASDMIRKRVNAAHDKYQAQMRNARGNMNAALSALQTLKKEYVYVYRIASALPIEPRFRSQIVKMVQDQADQTQRSLEQSAAADRTGHLVVAVRNAKVNQLDR